MSANLLAAAAILLALILLAFLYAGKAGPRCASCGQSPVPWRGALCRTCWHTDRMAGVFRNPIMVYRCECGQRLQARPLTGVWPRACPACGLARPKPASHHYRRN
jgi:hypothetical protein